MKCQIDNLKGSWGFTAPGSHDIRAADLLESLGITPKSFESRPWIIGSTQAYIVVIEFDNPNDLMLFKLSF